MVVYRIASGEKRWLLRCVTAVLGQLTSFTRFSVFTACWASATAAILDPPDNKDFEAVSAQRSHSTSASRSLEISKNDSYIKRNIYTEQ